MIGVTAFLGASLALNTCLSAPSEALLFEAPSERQPITVVLRHWDRDSWAKCAQCCIRFCTEDGGCESAFLRSPLLPALEIYLSKPCATSCGQSFCFFCCGVVLCFACLSRFVRSCLRLW